MGSAAEHRTLSVARLRAASEAGSALLEVLVSSVMLLAVAGGVLASLDSTTRISGQQRARAVAGNVAQSEQERLRALPLTELSNSHSVTTRQAAGRTYTVESWANWVTDSAAEASCATGGATADYLSIDTTVSSPALGTAKPVSMNSIVSPPARAFDAGQGALAVQALDSKGAPVADLPMSLTGPRNVTGVTNEKGCVLWGYLPAGNTYHLTFSTTGWVDPSGATSVDKTITIVGEQTRNEVVNYDRGGALRAHFVTTPVGGSVKQPTKPVAATIENPGPPATTLSYSLGTSDVLETPLLYPFTSDYSVYASCGAAKPTSPVVADVVPGQTVDTADVVLPSLAVTVKNGSTVLSGARVTVSTACGTRISRLTNASGTLDDPGYPWGALTVCAQKGTSPSQVYKKVTVTNTTLPGTTVAPFDLSTGTTAGGCP